MIRADDTALLLLAAGRSRRFPGMNKLEAEFLHKPVGLHVVTALEAIPFAARIVVVDHCALDFAGYRVIRNDDPDEGMGISIRLGVAAAMEGRPAAIVVALADMPRVTAAHIYRLLDAADGPDVVVASSDGERPRPPVLFAAGRFDALLRLPDDTIARDLVRGGKHVVTSPAELIDIDTPEELEALRASVHAPEAIRGAARRSD